MSDERFNDDDDDDGNEHAWFRERIAAALAGGLTQDERRRFEAHAEACAECAAERRAARELEQHMGELFAVPAVAGVEDRIIGSLRAAAWRRHAPRLPLRLPRPVVHPAVRKAVAGVAAAIVLAGFGYVVSQQLGESPFAAARQAPLASSAGKPYSGTTALGRGFKLNNSIGAEFAVAGDVGRAATAPASGGGRGGGGIGAGARWFAERPSFDRKAEPAPVQLGDGVATINGAKLFAGVNRDNAYAYKDRESAGEKQAVQNYFGGFGVNKAGAGTLTINGTNTFRGTAVHGGRLVTDADGDGTAKPGAADTGVTGKNVYWDLSALSRRGGETDAKKRVDTPVADESIAEAPAKAPADVSGREQTTLGVAVQVPASPAPAQNAPPPAAPQPAEAKPPSSPPKPEQPAPQPTTRKVIRNGTMEFEVDRFDAAFAQVSKLAQEAGGYVGTADSEKLPNGKVKGTVTVRVPPDRLDTLVLQLRGIGDLKSQKLEAQDVSKQYSDMDSQLRAARAMEERLLGIIKEGKGQIKDLLAAEKELGVWREKIEHLVGEMRYYDNLVALSTLNVTLFERDIRTPATATETETIDAGVEASDVEKARADALKAIEEAKGRIVQSDLKRYDAGQFGATIAAEVPPDASGPLLDRLKQIGKVARLDVQRRQEKASDPQGNLGAQQPPVKIEKRDTRLNLSLYNLANVAPRQTTSLNLAAEDVEQAYQTIAARVGKTGGRVVNSTLARNKPEQTTGTINFEVPSADADAVLAEVRKLGEPMKLQVAENPDVQNTTSAKRGFTVNLIASAAVPPRETRTLVLASTKVPEAREKILSAAGEGKARVLAAQLNENDPANPNATIEIDVPRAALPAVEKAIADGGDTISRVVTRSSDTENTLDTRVKLQLTLTPAEKLPPRETTGMTVELRDVDGGLAKLQLAAQQAGGRIVDSNLSREINGQASGKLAVDVPAGQANAVIDQARQLGSVRAVRASQNPQVPGGSLSRARIEVTLVTPDTLVEPGTGVWATIRNGLATSVTGLLWSLRLIVIGLCFVLPWVLILAIGWRLVRRRNKSAAPATA
jgi:autotransporter-associated beta strand protein